MDLGNISEIEFFVHPLQALTLNWRRCALECVIDATYQPTGKCGS